MSASCPQPPPERITLTFPVLHAAREVRRTRLLDILFTYCYKHEYIYGVCVCVCFVQVAFIAAGAGKASLFHEAFQASATGTTAWVLDFTCNFDFTCVVHF